MSRAEVQPHLWIQMINANETNLAAVDVLDGRLPEEEVDEVALRHRAHEIRRWKKRKSGRLWDKLGWGASFRDGRRWISD